MDRADAEAIALAGGEPARELVVRLLDMLDQVAGAVDEVVGLRERVLELERQQNRTSLNSSVAPSSDRPLTRQQRRALARERAKRQLERERREARKQGGQPGHAGSSRRRCRCRRRRPRRSPSLAATVARDWGVRLVRTPTSLGPGCARNAGIAAARGAYVLPLDADDVLAPHYIATAVAMLKACPDAGVCYSTVQAFGAEAWTWEAPAGWSLRDLVSANRIPNSSVYRQRCWAQTGGYQEELPCCEDWELWIAIACQGWTFARVLDVGYFYRTHASNRSYDLASRYAESRKLIQARHRGAGANHPISYDVEHPAPRASVQRWWARTCRPWRARLHG